MKIRQDKLKDLPKMGFILNEFGMYVKEIADDNVFYKIAIWVDTRDIMITGNNHVYCKPDNTILELYKNDFIEEPEEQGCEYCNESLRLMIDDSDYYSDVRIEGNKLINDTEYFTTKSTINYCYKCGNKL